MTSSYLLSAQDRKKVLSQGQKIAASRRVKNKQDNRGRPIKSSGIYYIHQVLLDDATYALVRKHRMHHEPLGSVVHRLVTGQILEFEHGRKKVEAQVSDSPDSLEDWQYADTQTGNKVLSIKEIREKYEL